MNNMEEIIEKINGDVTISLERRIDDIIEELRFSDENYHLVKLLGDVNSTLKSHSRIKSGLYELISKI